ncbi:MAG: hypothetical protein VR64_08060 [Desulfatitalea sp. BRH_c12]|nr:MAG: hypothetical protein VR64_08060 [Desulfatitalea sp. BRH_c12]
MSIKMLAQDLYRCQKEVEQLEQELADAAPGQRGAVENKLRKIRAEWDYLRKALDGRIGR